MKYALWAKCIQDVGKGNNRNEVYYNLQCAHLKNQ